MPWYYKLEGRGLVWKRTQKTKLPKLGRLVGYGESQVQGTIHLLERRLCLVGLNHPLDFSACIDWISADCKGVLGKQFRWRWLQPRQWLPLGNWGALILGVSWHHPISYKLTQGESRIFNTQEPWLHHNCFNLQWSGETVKNHLRHRKVRLT